jgi:hypothetical protein
MVKLLRSASQMSKGSGHPVQTGIAEGTKDAEWLVVQLERHGNESEGRPKDTMFRKLVVVYLCMLSVSGLSLEQSPCS